MQDQHKHITGYRDLTAEEISLMNEGKALAEQVGAFSHRRNDRLAQRRCAVAAVKHDS